MLVPLSIALMLSQTPTPAAKAPGLQLSSKLKADFNAAKNRVRLLFIWAPS